MWGLWLIDPSGKYGPNKVFAEHGDTAEEAFASCASRYRHDVQLDPRGGHFIINPARGEKSSAENGANQ